MTWNIEATDEFTGWYRSLDQDEWEAVNAAVAVLEERGPTLGRPLVAEIDTSHESGANRIKNLKELRPGTMRVLFCFDPRRTGILLVGGNKAGEWKAWYRRAIPEAERLYAEYLAELRQEGVLG